MAGTPEDAERFRLHEMLMVYFGETGHALGGWNSIEGSIFEGQLMDFAAICQEAKISPEVFRRRSRSAVGSVKS